MSEEAEGDIWTVQRLLQWTREWLTRQGSATPRLDGELLLAHVLKTDRLHLLLRFDQPVEAHELAAYKQLIKRRARLEPVAYILGKKSFFDLDLEVSSAVLVPRPETESLVDAALAFLTAPDALAGDVLDLCTGSGCIALAIATHPEIVKENRAVVATDVSDAALAQAKRNADSLHATVDFARGDLLQAVAPGRKFACIVSNPPYVRSADIDRLDRDVRDWEPRMALDGGKDGSDLVRRILDRACEFLLPGGLLLIEVGSRGQADDVIAWGAQRGLGQGRPEAILGGPTQLVRWSASPAAADATT